MKKIVFIISAVAALFMLSSCEVNYPLPVVNPDPVFDNNGFQQVPTISIYDIQEETFTISRVYGLSKEVEVRLSIDAALIDDYNAIYASSYTLMPEEYYTIPETVTFAVHAKTAKVPVTVRVKDLVKDKGIEAASKMIIPVRMADASVEIADAGDMGNVMVNLNINVPQITVQLPVENEKLEFISAIPLTQSISITANANFSTLDPEKVTYVADESKVAEFNKANGTNCKFLPADRFKVQPGVFDGEKLTLTNEVVFDCASIGGDDVYVCPLVISDKAGYTLNQAEPLYVIVEMSELRIWITDADAGKVTSTGTGAVDFQMNSPMLDDQSISLVYDAAKVDAYNQKHGTDHKALAADKCKVTASRIAAGARTGSVEYNMDIKELMYDTGDTLIVPLSIDPSVLVQGTVIDDSAATIYIKIYKTLSGVYTQYETQSVFAARDKTAQGGNNAFQNVIYLADGKTLAGPAGSQKVVPESGHGQKYAVYYCVYLWAYFDIDWDNELADKPGCYPLINLRDRVEGFDEITNNASYFDNTNEEFIFDFITLGWWGPGGGGGGALDDPSHLPGELWHTKLTNRQ